MPHRASSCSEWQHKHRKIRRPITSKSKLHNSSAFDINHMTYSSHFFCLSFFISLCGSIYGRLYSFFLVQFFLVPIYILILSSSVARRTTPDIFFLTYAPGMLYPSFFAKGRINPPRQQSTCNPIPWATAILPRAEMGSITPYGDKNKNRLRENEFTINSI